MKPIKKTRAVLKAEVQKAEREEIARKKKAVRAFLSEVKALTQKVDTRADEIVRQQTLLFFSGVEGGEVVRKTTELDPIGEGFVKLVESVDELDTDLVAYSDTKTKAIETLDGIAGTVHYDVLRYRFLESRSVKDTAEILGYSQDHIKRLQREAIVKLYDFIPREFRQK